MSEALVGTPAKVVEQLLARYLPLRDSRAHSMPELHQRKLLKRTAYLMVISGISVEVLLLVTRHVTALGVLFGLGVVALARPFDRMSQKPLMFAPPEPLENLAALSQGLGLCRSLAKAFPQMPIVLDPLSCTLDGSCDGYVWHVTVDREGLKPIPRDQTGYDNSYTVLAESAGNQPVAGKIWTRTAKTVNRHRIVWTVAIEDEFKPRAGRPGEHTMLESHDVARGASKCVFTLPVNEPDQPGLGHEGRGDYISSPVGLHHPEFVGEQIALSLIWLFNPARL